MELVILFPKDSSLARENETLLLKINENGKYEQIIDPGKIKILKNIY